jgi:hypothetical protein
MTETPFPVQPEALGIVAVLTDYLWFIFAMRCGFSATGGG